MADYVATRRTSLRNTRTLMKRVMCITRKLRGSIRPHMHHFNEWTFMKKVICIMRKDTWVDPDLMCIVLNEWTLVKRITCIMRKVTWIAPNPMCIMSKIMCIMRIGWTLTIKQMCDIPKLICIILYNWALMKMQIFKKEIQKFSEPIGIWIKKTDLDLIAIRMRFDFLHLRFKMMHSTGKKIDSWMIFLHMRIVKTDSRVILLHMKLIALHMFVARKD